jgi:hypothetical protein
MRGVVVGSLLMALAPACAPSEAQSPQSRILDGEPGPALQRFTSTAAFERYVKSLRRRFEVNEPVPAPMAIAPPTLSVAEPAADSASVPAASGNPEITNNQNVGVDEGGIVKQIGRHLIVLQDGRVFAVDLGKSEGNPLRLTDRIDVYRSEAKAASWYDEMLVLGDRVLVTAYNYAENASEITVLRLSPQGKLRREGRFLLSSNDYYSTENYATRLVGDSLVFYAPLPLDGGRFEWPRIRRATGDGEADRGDALIRATDVYAPPGKIDEPVLHTVSICPLAATLDCRTTAFVGAPMREFYVSPTDAFLWIGAPDGMPWAIDYANRRRAACPRGQTRGEAAPATLYRLPLRGGPVGAVAVDGVPTDQFALDSKAGRFRALLNNAGAGCSVDERGSELALLDIPLSAFGARLRHVAPQAYTPVPGIAGGQLENRFIGDWLVYGGRENWSAMAPDDGKRLTSTLFAVPLADPRSVRRLALPHNAVRIERAGMDAVVTGYRNAEGLSLSYVVLGSDPRRAATTLLPGRFESEGRSHAFNAWVPRDGTGVLGIPTTRREWRSGRGWSDSESSDLSFVAIGPARQLAPAGELTTRSRAASPGYVCKVSCVDWYGNSRPIFTSGRIFALMGTELVEGQLRDGRIREVGRADLTGRPLS